MRIAVITPGFSGSTLPLEKKLLQRDIEIDHYQIAYCRINELESFPLNFSSARMGVHILSEGEADEIYRYMGNERYFFKVLKLPRPYGSIPIVRNISRFFLNIALKKIARDLNKQKYDLVLFVGQYKDGKLFQLVTSIKFTKIVALHEVCNHRGSDFSHPTDFLKYLSKNKIPIVVFSKNSFQDINKYGIFESSNIYQINFGVFEGYSLYPVMNNLDLPSEYILYLGSISSYKGLDVLYDAVNCVNEWPCKFVVAGLGSLDCVEKMKKDSRFVVINRFLKNIELVELVSKCKFIVCPYRSASQSGIPQTAFVFKRPVVASNIKSFEEIIGKEECGLLFEKEKSKELCLAMQELLVNKELYAKIQSNISQLLEDRIGEYSWNSIVEKYENLFFKLI